MLFSGLLGGFANWVILSDEKNASNEQSNNRGKIIWKKSLILGITASFMVPLFLTTISSELLNKPLEGTFNKSYLVFAGFCLLAAVLSKQFIESLYQKVMKAEARAKEAEDIANKAKDKIEAVENNFSEPETDANQQVLDNNRAENTIEDRIIEAIRNVKYLYRSTSGITNDLSKHQPIPKEEVRMILNQMVGQGRLQTKVNEKGTVLYAIKNG
ncbi:uncharacterized protein YneF (UPF0154 family) [Mucilaginibacter rubeus]